MPAVLAYHYAELAVSSLAVAETITSTHCIYPQRDGQAVLAWVAGYMLRWYNHLNTVTRPNTNRSQRRVTLWICSSPLPLRQTSNQMEEAREKTDGKSANVENGKTNGGGCCLHK